MHTQKNIALYQVDIHTSATTIRRFSADIGNINSHISRSIVPFSESILFDFSFGHIFGSTGPTEKYNHLIYTGEYHPNPLKS